MPVNTFWSALDIVKLNDGTDDITVAIWVFKNEELNIAVRTESGR